MRIRMLVEKTGPRYDGRFWPGPGGEIDVDNEEGRALCIQGDAAPVARRDADVETRASDEDENAETRVSASVPAADVTPRAAKRQAPKSM